MVATRRNSKRARVLTRDPSTLVLNQTPWAGQAEVGTRISVLFDVGKANEAWYEATITGYNLTDNTCDYKYTVLYCTVMNE